MEEKQNLILISGSSRFDNLLYMAKTININYDKYSEYFNIYWLICKDIYNGKGNCDNAIEYLNTTHIKYFIYDTGKPNQKNYGGDLFNEPLKKFITDEIKDKSWIYILDDDNILHPNLYNTFKKCIELENFKDKKGIILTKRSKTSHVHEMMEENICMPINFFVYIWFIPDPSQIILKYTFLEENGMYAPKTTYDYDFILPLISQNKQYMLYYNDYNGCFSDKICAYHNNLRTLDELNKFNNQEELYIDIALQSDKEIPINFPILSEKSKQKILKIIKEDLKEFNK